MKEQAKKLYEALKAIDNKESHIVQRMYGREYLQALEVIGYCKIGWDDSLTDFGKQELNRLYSESW